MTLGGQAATKSMMAAMTPGAGHQKLGAMVGIFDVKLKAWSSPSTPPAEFWGTSVNTWVLGERFVQMMFSAISEGEFISAISYMGYDNVSRKYVVTSMDTGGTGMEWFTGTLDAPGKSLLFKATIDDPVTGKPSPAEMRIRLTDDSGDNVTELWSEGPDGKMFEMMELVYTRKK